MSRFVSGSGFITQGAVEPSHSCGDLRGNGAACVLTGLPVSGYGIVDLEAGWLCPVDGLEDVAGLSDAQTAKVLYVDTDSDGDDEVIVYKESVGTACVEYQLTSEIDWQPDRPTPIAMGEVRFPLQMTVGLPSCLILRLRSFWMSSMPLGAWTGP